MRSATSSDAGSPRSSRWTWTSPRPSTPTTTELVPPGGHPITKREYLDAIRSGALDYEVFVPASEIRVRRLGATAAAVRYRARILIHDDQGGTDAGVFWHTDLYELRDGRWQAAWSQATRIRRPATEA